jgi:hypothetical protein
MSNVLTALAADIYKAADIVGREQVGFIPSATINSDALKKVAFGDTVRSFFTRKSTVNTVYTPSMTIPEGDDQTVDNKTMSLDQVANVKIPWTGEDIKHVDNGSGYSTIYGDQIAQAMRGITNSIESYVGLQVSKGWSRGFGVAGTTPFGANFNEVAELRRILVDNGCPMDGQVSLVFNSAAGVKLRNLAQLQKVNEAGNDTLLRQGTLLNLQGINFKESAGVPLRVAGTGAAYVVNAAGGLAVGTTAIPTDIGAGTILAGDAVTFQGDTRIYGVGTTLAAGSFALNSGLLAAQVDENTITVGGNATINAAFHRSAVEIAVRAPAMPPGGDAAVDRMTVQDPWSGLVYEIAAYKGYGKVMFDITTFYSVKVWKPDFVAALFG